MERRIFLKTAAILAADSLINNSALAEDYRKNNNDTYQKQYLYNPFSGNQEQPIETHNNILPLNQNQQKDFWSMPRKIYIKRTATNEQSHIVYHANGQLNEEGYKAAAYLLRDVQQNKMIGIDLKLLDLLCAVQSWLLYYGINSPLLINSGYRTDKTNGSLEGAAKNSMHLYGRAVDFTIPNLSPLDVAKIAAQFKAGGIGIYPSRNFIHLDTGGIRTWVK